MEQLIEEQLIAWSEEMKAGNLTNFTAFYDATKQSVYYSAYAVLNDAGLSEDVVQETFIRFLQSSNRLRPGTNPLGFLLTIARNQARTIYKRRKSETDFPSELDESIVPANDSMTLNEDEFFAQVKKLLKPLEYEIVMLHVVDGLAHREIADIIHRPLGSVTWLYQQAIKKLNKERSWQNYEE